jgi:4-hydroxybenzoate polyprenyltransferase
LRLGRVSNLPTVWTNALAGVAIAGGRFALVPTLVLIFALSLAYVAGMFLNDAFDRRIDAVERPERPIISGDISAAEVFGAGFTMLGAAVGLVAVSAVLGSVSPVMPTCAAIVLSAAIVLYDGWHKQNPASPLIMGLCRGTVYVTAGLAAGGNLSGALIAAAFAILAYVAGLTLVARQENRASFKGYFFLAWLAMPAAVAIFAGDMNGLSIAALALFALWVNAAAAPLFSKGPINVPRAVVRLIAGICLVDGLLGAAFGAPWLAACGPVGLALTLAFQRWVRGT